MEFADEAKHLVFCNFSQSLKSDLEAEIDKKLKQKLKSQQAEIQNLRHCIDQLKADNQGVGRR
jgi:hypothetical protein